MDKDERLAIANEIYAQLGGVRFSLVTGARPISISETKDGDLELTFKIGRNGSKANHTLGYYELKEIRYKFMPNNMHVAQIFPPREEFVNVHPNCFHLWELDNNQ